MNPYAMLGSGMGTNDAASLAVRLSAWHDAMVAHERRLRSGSTSDRCDDECPHAQAQGLWSEAVATFGSRANELVFLRSRANDTRRWKGDAVAREPRSEAPDKPSRTRASRDDIAAPDRFGDRRIAAEL
jgi:hypothetical protein